jgi:hypothetical protein
MADTILRFDSKTPEAERKDMWKKMERSSQQLMGMLGSEASLPESNEDKYNPFWALRSFSGLDDKRNIILTMSSATQKAASNPDNKEFKAMVAKFEDQVKVSLNKWVRHTEPTDLVD